MSNLVLTSALTSLVAWQIYRRFEPAKLLPTSLLLLGIPTYNAYHYRYLFLSALNASLASFLLYWGFLITFIVLYRISPVHPIANYPGPLPAKISKGWLAYVASRGDLHLYVRELHERYGDAVRIGPNELSFRHVDLVEPVLANKEVHKGPYYDTRVKYGVTPLDGIKDYSEHAARRRLWNRGLSIASAKEYTESLKTILDQFLHELGQRHNQVIDISKWMSFITCDFMCHMTFSTSFDMIKAGRDHNGLVELIDKTMYSLHIIAQVPWVYPYIQLLPSTVKAVKKLLSISKGIADKRAQLGSTKRDLYHYLLDEDGLEPVKPSEHVATAEGFLSIIAGSDTSATALTNAIYFLLQNPEVKTRLEAEVRKALSEAEDTPDYTKYVDLPYLNACINETLRLLSPGLSGLQRQVDPSSEGKMLGQYYVPSGTSVSVHLYAIQRDPRYFFPLPDTFWPDRWLTQETYTLPSGEKIPKQDIILNRNAFCPFSAGQQGCAGKNVANLELRSILTALLHRFDIQTAKGFQLDDYERNMADAYVALRGSLPVQLRPRVI